MTDYLEYSKDHQFKLEVWETSEGTIPGLCKWTVKQLVDGGLWETIRKSARLEIYDSALFLGQEALRDAINYSVPISDGMQLRAEAAEQEIRQILSRLKHHCQDDFVVITDGAIDWTRTVDEFVGFIRLDKEQP